MGLYLDEIKGVRAYPHINRQWHLRDDMYSSSNYEKLGLPQISEGLSPNALLQTLDWLKGLRKINSQDLTQNLMKVKVLSKVILFLSKDWEKFGQISAVSSN